MTVASPERTDGPASKGEAARLSARDLACRRGNRLLFSAVDFDLEAGDAVWLRAANGYGKTSLLRILAGLAKPEAGTVETRFETHRPLYLAHANALKDDLTVAESLLYLVKLHDLAASEDAQSAAIERFGLHARRGAPIRTLSQGQRRRVALTRLCLSPSSATWLLDEPYDALDQEASALVSTLIADHAARGGSVLLTSHVAPDIAGMRTLQLDAIR
jgi:heme exporter protein A